MAQRRTKIEVLNEKISKVDSKIAACTEKIAALEDEKTALAAQLDEIRKAEKKAKEAAELKRLLGSLTVEYTKKCLQALWCLLFLRQIFCFIL